MARPPLFRGPDEIRRCDECKREILFGARHIVTLPDKTKKGLCGRCYELHRRQENESEVKR